MRKDNQNFFETDIKDLLPIKKLDETLKFLIESKPAQQTVKQIWEGINFESNFQELEEILNKLEKDGYAVQILTGQFSLRVYQSTFEGRFFKVEMGGYLQKIQDDYQNRLQVKLRNRQDRLNQKLLTGGAVGAAVGAIALVIWEMCKYFLLDHK